MTLKEKFENYYDPKWLDKETSTHYCEQIADEFAIGFAEWLSKKERTKFQSLSCCKKTIIWFTSKKGIGATTSELLEIYKKEHDL